MKITAKLEHVEVHYSGEAIVVKFSEDTLPQIFEDRQDALDAIQSFFFLQAESAKKIRPPRPDRLGWAWRPNA